MQKYAEIQCLCVSNACFSGQDFYGLKTGRFLAEIWVAKGGQWAFDLRKQTLILCHNTTGLAATNFEMKSTQEFKRGLRMQILRDCHSRLRRSL
jgi:hypothetical protein